MLSSEQKEQLAEHLVTSFDNAMDLNTFLVMQVWPRFKLQGRYRASDSPISDHVTALDGSPMTKQAVEMHARKGLDVLEKSTGRPQRYNARAKRWLYTDGK